MNILDLADVLDKQITIKSYPNQGRRLCASFDHCETKDSKESGVLCGSHGNGTTPIKALNDYSGSISGKVLVFDAMTDDRSEFTCPKLDSL